MSILLICRRSSGTITIDERHYSIAHHMAVLTGYADEVLRRDAEVLLSMPGGLYGMPTPDVQEKFMQEQRKQRTIQE